MQETTRNLKVYSTTGKPFPKINLQGKWLAQLGFTIGDYIKVTVNEDQIMITKVESPKELPKVNYKTKLPKQTVNLVKESANNYHVQEEDVIAKALLDYFKKKGSI